MIPEFDAPKILSIYLQMAQYPILARQIRFRMREELHRRGVITPERLEAEVREKALLSQRHEGWTDPQAPEDDQQWQQRLIRVRDTLIDFYFAYNLPTSLFQQIVDELLAKRSTPQGELVLPFNPELAPFDILIKHAELYDALPEDQKAKVSHHLQEIMVVLTKTMISDRLDFVRIAKEWFTVDDFKFIHSRRIGTGKIGGKSAGLLLAWKILLKTEPAIAKQLVLPESYFIGADVLYEFLAINGLEYVDQKYKSPEQYHEEYPQIKAAFENGHLPEDITEQLRTILDKMGKKPLIVRSSSLLEDNVGTSFAGKYASFYLPNQGSLEENLKALTLAIRRVYASIHQPDALMYRRHMRLLDYDERMAILLQEVQGQTYRHFFFPSLAGVAFSRSPIVWNPRLRREEGFVRLVLGLGTRAVERVGDDYPRVLTLSHPLLRPEVSPAAIQRYSQRYVDLIDLETNTLSTRPIEQTLELDFPALRWVASVSMGDTVLPLFALGPQVTPERLVLTFDNLLQQSNFVPLMKTVLSTLARYYEVPVDIEFVVTVIPASPRPQLTFHLLQCRPQSSMRKEEVSPIPADLPDEDKIFLSKRMAPEGQVRDVEYIVFVDPSGYEQLSDADRRAVARIVGRLNKALEGRNFILIGPGRWGSADPRVGVPITYSDIYNSRALVELAVAQHGICPEPSYGTHFFQDLMESQIYPLAVYPDDPREFLNLDFLSAAHDCLSTVLAHASEHVSCIKVIELEHERAGKRLSIVMDGEQSLAYLSDISKSETGVEHNHRLET
jgi:Pyruvate phosphate dikinase, AMP/ATP-binding domain